MKTSLLLVRILVLILFASGTASSDDIYLTNGYVWSNVAVLELTADRVRFRFVNESQDQIGSYWFSEKTVLLGDIAKIVKSAVNNGPSSYLTSDTSNTRDKPEIEIQNMTPEQMNRYLFQRKEIGAGILYSFLLPGGGHFYAEDGAGVPFLIAEVGCTVWFVVHGIDLLRNTKYGESHAASALTPIWVLLVIRVIDIATVPLGISSYNKNLRQSLSLNYTPKGLTLSYNF